MSTESRGGYHARAMRRRAVEEQLCAEREFEEGWTIIGEKITKLQNQLERVTGPEMYSLYDSSLFFDMNRLFIGSSPPHLIQQLLFERYKKTLVDYTNVVALPALREKHGESLLREVLKRWNNQKFMVYWLSADFGSLDIIFAPVEEMRPLQSPTTTEAGLMCFRDQVYAEMKNKIKDAVITLIQREREGEHNIDRSELKNVLGIFFTEIGRGGMDAYESEFEQAMLTDTAAYYSRKAALRMEKSSFRDYFLKAEQSLSKETEIAAHYLHASSEQKLLEIVQHELISQYEKQFLENVGDRYHPKMDGLFRNLPKILVPVLVPVIAIFKRRVIDEGTALVKQAEDAARDKNTKCRESDTDGGQEPWHFVTKVIELHDKYLQYVSETFDNNYLFRNAVEEAFAVFCYKGIAGWTTAELLAIYCDNLLKKGGGEKLSEEAVKHTLEKVVQFVAFLSGRDLFEEFYRKKLARRLLFDDSANDDHERSIVSKLKQSYGWQFTSKMEGMIIDLALTKETQRSFEGYLNEDSSYSTSNPGIDLTVTVLTTKFWPGFKSSDFTLPVEMAKCVEVYNEFYRTNTKRHRKLTWISSLGTCTINGKFDPKPIELIVTTHQAAVLLLFNTAERLSYADIKGQLNATDEDIVRLLHSLSCAKYKILNKDPATKIVSPADSFEFNTKFTDKARRIKISLHTLITLDQEKKKDLNVIKHVYKDRRYAIDASLIRLMKSHRVLRHQELVRDCVEQLRRMFKPEVKEIKKRIEDLIAREYLERDKDDPDMLRYLN